MLVSESCMCYTLMWLISSSGQMHRFLPLFTVQMIKLYQDPNGEKIFDSNMHTKTHHTPSKNSKSGTEMIMLQNKVQEQEKSIRLKDKKISELERTLMNIEVWSIILMFVWSDNNGPTLGSKKCFDCAQCTIIHLLCFCLCLLQKEKGHLWSPS